ncbi:MAG: RnfH family protein [Gammaproteobacteria bacterium]|nr:RnfH family protein [Gammaproteobacteria bacterium]
MTAGRIDIEIAYARSDIQLVIPLSLTVGVCARDAIEQSGLLNRFKDIDLSNITIGIFGKRVDKDYIVKDGDRIEIYRPLTIDPKQARKHRATLAKSKSK